MADFGASEIAYLTGALGGPLLGGLTAPEGQELQTFEGTGATDPRNMMGETRGVISDLLTALLDEAAKPTTVKTTVNPLPSFAGGGLPMAIGAMGQDPNRLNPDLRTTPGFSMKRRRLTGGTDPAGGPVQRAPTPGDDYTIPPDGGSGGGREREPTGRRAEPRGGSSVWDPTRGGGQDPELEELMNAFRLLGVQA